MKTPSRILLDPTSERSLAVRERLPRPPKLEGLTVGLLDISKARGDLFLDRLEQRLGALMWVHRRKFYEGFGHLKMIIPEFTTA